VVKKKKERKEKKRKEKKRRLSVFKRALWVCLQGKHEDCFL